MPTTATKKNEEDIDEKSSISSSNDDTSNLEVVPSSLWIEGGTTGIGTDNDYLTSSTCPIVALDTRQRYWAITGGNAIDSQILRRKIQGLAESWRESNDDGSPTRGSRLYHYDSDNSNSGAAAAAVLARRLADHLQLATQTVGGRSGRMLVSSAVFIGHDGDLWRVDPTGQFWECHAAIVGRGSDKAEMKFFEKVIMASASTLNHNDDDNNKTGKEGAGTIPVSAVSSSQVEAYLNTLSIEDALKIASQCIREALSNNDFKLASSEETKKKQQHLPRLKGLSIPYPVTKYQTLDGKKNAGGQMVTPKITTQFVDEQTLLSFAK